MNLFIFRVETGTMLEFQLDMATESVAQLKIEIMKILQVPPEDQVLLVSGGISLENSAKVISYSAGTDTNPIYMFSKQSIESPYPPNASPSPNAYTGFQSRTRASQNTSTSDYDNNEHDDSDDGAPSEGESSYNEFRKRVNKSKKLPVTMDTVVKRASLAQNFYEEALRESRCCQSIVHDQHLQHQGWAVAIANLEDITGELQTWISRVQKFFGDYLGHRDDYVTFLNVYKEALGKLSKIPIIPSLLLTESEQPAANNEELEEEKSDGNLAKGSLETKTKKTLLEWIEARRDSESETTMETLYESSVRGVEFYQHEMFTNLYTEVQIALDTASQKDMKEIHGLSDRLYGLDTLLRNVELHLKEQEYSAESFQKNQSRAGNLGDTSVLPDLCDSHRKQLVGMLKNHWKLCDIHKRCMRSKEELCNNLYQRLKWVIHVETLIRCSTDRILAYYENVLRLRFHISVLQQIHLAPDAYMSAVIEVVRRKTFSQAFLLWASELACYMLTIYNEEVTKRKEFKSKYDGHFLMGLFPGMNDLPPSFATQAPSIFDSSLPNISMEDIEEIRTAIPEMAEQLLLPDMTAITNFFLSKSSMVKNEVDTICVEEKLVQVINEVGLASNLDQNLLKPTDSETCLLPHGIAQLKDLDKGCESETDTEEFEKVCQSPMDMQFDKDLPSPRPGYNDVTTITEVGDKCLLHQQQQQQQQPQLLPPKKPPRTFLTYSHSNSSKSINELSTQRALSISGGSHSESFTNIKNTSLESIDELSSLKNVGDSCYNSHHQHLQGGGGFVRSKSLSPHTPFMPPSPKLGGDNELITSPSSPMQGHQPSDFVSEEFYIDESLPSSLSIDATCGQPNGEIAKQLSNANDVVALLQDNLQSSRSEQDKLKDLLLNMATLCRAVFANVRQEIEDIKSRVRNENSTLELHCKSLSSSWDNLANEFDMKEKEIHKLTESHQVEVCTYRQQLKNNGDELKCLREENSCLDSSLNKLADENKQLLDNLTTTNDNHITQISDLEAKLQELQYDKERSIKETVDRLNREHKSEIDNLRNRFRLVTDRSPSECMEKSVACDAAVQQTTENVKVEKILQERNKEFEFELARMREEAKRNVDEKDKLIQILRERETSLNLECMKHKNTLLQLTQSEMESSTSELKKHIEDLKKEKQDLEHMLTNERLQRMESSEMSTSTSSTIAAKRTKFKEPLTISQTSLVSVARVNVETCSKGDTVLVIWKPTYKHFIVVQESDVLHFVHSDCIKELEAHTSACTHEDKRIYFTALVLDKEYCQTKKSENRYNVPKGTKFYRVKIRPLNMPDDYRSPQIQMTQSHTVSKTITQAPMDESVSDSACHSLPSSPTKEDK